MSWRDIVVALVVFGSLPYAFRQPFIGLVVFSWLAYMRVQDLCWGFARTMRFSYFVAIAMFAGFFIFEGKSFFRKDIRNYLLIALGVVVSASVVLTKYEITDLVVNYYLEFLKIIAIALITTSLVTSQERLRILVWTITLSLGFFGVKSGLWGVLTGGTKQILRGPGGLMADNNDFSLALTMNLPFLFYLGLSEPNKWVRRGLIAAVGLTCIAIVLTFSRGGFLAMSATLGLMLWRSRNRVIGFALAAVAGVLFLVLAPAGVKERLSSIKKYDEDSSAQARLHTWNIALQMIAASPIVGVGFRNFQSAYVEFDPEPLKGKEGTGTRAYFVAHNSYLQLGAESGLIALGIYLALFISCFIVLYRIRTMAMERYETGWILNYVRMFEASLAGFLVGAIFLNRGHFDFAYHVISIVTAFSAIAYREMTSEARYPLRARAVGRVESLMGFGRHGMPESGLAVALNRGGAPASLGAAATVSGELGGAAAARTGFGSSAPAGGAKWGGVRVPRAFGFGAVRPFLGSGFRRKGR